MVYSLNKCLEILRCPVCHGNLELLEDRLKCSKCRRTYSIKEDCILDLLPEEFIYGNDLKWMKFYDKTAHNYFRLFHRVIPIFTLGAEGRARIKWIKRLRLKEGDVVLDIATGTGRNLPYLYKMVGDRGTICGIDISYSMLIYAIKIARMKKNIILIRANASHLPFKDNTFDAIFHVGGINTFEEKEMAVKEMFRVAKLGAKIVIVDEGLDPKLRNTWRGRRLLRSNKLYASTPPVEEVRKYTDEVNIEWGVIPNKLIPIWPYYLLEARKIC